MAFPSEEYHVTNEDSKVFRLEQKTQCAHHQLDCYIPEYYGLDLHLKGDLFYSCDTVDSKLYGDVTIATQANIHLNKAKA